MELVVCVLWSWLACNVLTVYRYREGLSGVKFVRVSKPLRCFFKFGCLCERKKISGFSFGKYCLANLSCPY